MQPRDRQLAGCSEHGGKAAGRKGGKAAAKKS
jgi:hypothetical protein